MEDFKESLKVQREKTGKIVITEQLKELLIEHMKGNITKKEIMAITGIGDKVSIELKIEEVVAQEPRLIPLYNDYRARKREDFEGYEFRAEAIEMLRNDYSQSIMAKNLGVSRRTFSTKIKKLQEKNEDNILGDLLKRHADRKMRRQTLTDKEMVSLNLQLDEYEEQYPVGKSRYEKRKTLEIRCQNLQKVISVIESMMEEGMTLKEISQRKIISEANYRKYKAELENLSKILEQDREKE